MPKETKRARRQDIPVSLREGLRLNRRQTVSPPPQSEPPVPEPLSVAIPPPAVDPLPPPPPPDPSPVADSPAVADPAPVAVPFSGYELPVEPLHRSAMPGDAKPHLGRLVTYSVGRTQRPCVGVLVQCRKCKRLHRYPWRWNWGIGSDVVSYQELRCFVRGARKVGWIALDPALKAENEVVHQAAHDAYDAWVAERAARKAARSMEGDSP